MDSSSHLKELLMQAGQACGLKFSPGQEARLLDYALALKHSHFGSALTWDEDAWAVRTHFKDAFLTLPDPVPASLCDVGTGLGLPGIPYALLLPDTQITLLESRESRAAFVQKLLPALLLEKQVTCIHSRVEVLDRDSKYRERFDWVTGRALAPFPMFLEWTAPLVKIGGTLQALRGDRDGNSMERFQACWTALGLILERSVSYSLEEGAPVRWNILFRKIAPCAAKFPRSTRQMQKGFSD